MRKAAKFLISLTTYLPISLLFIMPTFSFAQSNLIPCTDTCGFNDLMTLVNTIIRFILFDMAVPIAAIMFAYAGFLLITAGGEAAHARTKAKSIFTNAVIGLVVAVAAWIIVRTILSILGYNGAWIGL